MRVGLVCPYSMAVAGGVQHQVLEIAEALRHRGHEAQVIAPGAHDARLPAHVTTTGRDLPLRWNGAVARVHLGRGAGRVTHQWLSDGAFDVLHVHEPVTPSLGWHAVRSARVPVVGTAHTAQERGAVLRLAASTGGRRVRDRVDLWTAVSPDAAATLRRYWDGEPWLVPNGLDVARYAAGSSAPHDAQVRLLFLGRMEEPRKGLEVALQTFAALAVRHPGLVLDVAGPGDLDRVVRRLRPALPAELRARICSLGPVDMPDKADLLARADVVLAPQLGGESFGIVVAEAMAAGAAVVASDLPAFRRLLDDGTYGVLAPRGDVGAWARAVEALVVDPARRTRVGERARAGVDHLDWKRVIDRLLEVYAHALG